MPRLLTIALLALAHLLILLPLPAEAGAAGIVLLAGIVGLIVVEALLDGRAARADRIVWGLGVGLALLVWVPLYLSYLPGPLPGWPQLVVFDVIALAAIGAQAAFGTPSTQPPSIPSPGSAHRILFAAVVVLAALLRLVGLGFSEYQGDEATPIMRAAGVVQGLEQTLFVHRRGPVEVIVPAAQMALLPGTTEGSIRLTFALAGVLAAAAMFRMGTRLEGTRAGMIAALLFAVEGYAVGFGRETKYESYILLMGILAVDLMVAAHGGWPGEDGDSGDSPQAGARTGLPPLPYGRMLLLAAFYAATGLASHYDGVVAVLPVAWLAVLLVRQIGLKRTTRAALPGLALAVVLLASFYVPWLLDPSFAETRSHYARTLVATQGFFVNNLRYFVESAALYSGSIFVYGVAALLLAALLRLLVTRRLDAREAMLWLWFGFPFVVAMFVTATPGLHFYVFMPPLLLICAWTAARLDVQMESRLRLGRVVAIGLLAAAMVASISHLTRTFINWRAPSPQTAAGTRAPRLWPTETFATPQMFYGMPHRRGWKAAGVLYAEGTLRGAYSTNGDEWIADWYTRGVPICEDGTQVALIDEQRDPEEAASMRATFGDTFGQTYSVRVGGEERLTIYQAGKTGEPQPVDAAIEARRFDAEISSPWFPLPPRVTPPVLSPQNLRYGDGLLLAGASLFKTSAPPGGNLTLTVRWQSLAAVHAHYTLSLQIVGPEDRMIAQLDTAPACETGPTSDWESDERIYGYYRIAVAADAPPGDYPLKAILYDPSSMERLPVFAADGAPLGDAAEIARVQITP